MLIEISTPASLPLSLVQLEHLEPKAGPKTGLLGLTLQHPPVHLFAQAHASHLQITGARADKCHEQALKFLQYHDLKHRAEIEVELAIPMFMGLGSTAMLGLGTAQALAWLHGLPLDDPFQLAATLGLEAHHVLEMWGFAQGGLLLVDCHSPRQESSKPIARREIAHQEKDAWAIVCVFPRVPDDTPETLELDRLQALLQAGPYMNSASGALLTETLWPAVEADDIITFGQTLMNLQAMTQAALVEAGTPIRLSSAGQIILDLMRDAGALAWGQSLTGLCLYGLLKGAQASIALRKTLRQHLGPFGGIIMATITDNRGAYYIIKDETLATKLF